jgi:hypothetical protein
MKFGKQSRSAWETGITRFVAWLIALRGVQANHHVGCVLPVSFPFVWNLDCQTLLSVGTADWNRRYPTLNQRRSSTDHRSATHEVLAHLLSLCLPAGAGAVQALRHLHPLGHVFFWFIFPSPTYEIDLV